MKACKISSLQAFLLILLGKNNSLRELNNPCESVQFVANKKTMALAIPTIPSSK